jgi:lauroyl/myristoyl acyltransferase
MRRAWKKIRYRLEWLGLKSATKLLPLLSRKACYRLALLLGSLGAMLDRRGRRVALSNLRVAFGDEISSERRAQIVRECFGLERCVTFAHVWLHQRTGAPLINVHCEPLPGGRYRVVFHPRIEFPAGASLQEMAQACWDQFEPVVRKNPAPWLWMYKHWRYRPLAANLAAYPFYANISEDFERRLDEGARKLPPMTSKVKLPMVTPATL